jgi:nucleoid DNA-binding protein
MPSDKKPDGHQVTIWHLRRDLAKAAGVSQDRAVEFIHALVKSIVDGILSGRQVRIYGLGVFGFRVRKRRGKPGNYVRLVFKPYQDLDLAAKRVPVEMVMRFKKSPTSNSVLLALRALALKRAQSQPKVAV